MAKLNRENRVRTKRVEKQARKAARRLTSASDAESAAADRDELRAGKAGDEAVAPEVSQPAAGTHAADAS